jgi:hypothetical protein
MAWPIPLAHNAVFDATTPGGQNEIVNAMQNWQGVVNANSNSLTGLVNLTMTGVFSSTGSGSFGGALTVSATIQSKEDLATNSETGAQIQAKGTTDPNRILAIGYNTTGNYGFIQATQFGTATKDLRLQPNGSNVSIGATTVGFGSGNGVFAMGNAGVVPTTNPTAGGVLYIQAGSLKFRGSSGTVTTIAVA